MSQDLIESVASPFRRDKPLGVRVGDTVTVRQRIVEGDKERIQPFTGLVIAQRGGARGTFTVRRIVNNEGVERIFPMDSPRIVDAEVGRVLAEVLGHEIDPQRPHRLGLLHRRAATPRVPRHARP